MTAADEWLRIESLDLDAQGVAHDAAGKVVFVEDVLPGEEVQVRVRRSKANWAQATPVALRRPSAQRVQPRCPHFGVCGGCKMQHLHVGAQVAVKQRALEDALWHLAKVRPQRVLRPIEGPAWNYRLKARLSVRHVTKKGTVLVGFHERGSSYVADIRSCDVLPRHVSDLLLPLRALIGSLQARDRLPQIELAVGGDVTALVLRHLVPLSDEDRALLREFAQRHGIVWWLQAAGPDSAQPLDADAPTLAYTLPEFDVVVPHRPVDFAQVNQAINQALVGRAVRLLGAQRSDRVIDWFCGLGNFSLPIARQAGSVLGLEGNAALVGRARAAALLNGLSERTAFASRDLFALDRDDLLALGQAQRWLIDPPREGAFAIAKALGDAVESSSESGWTPPERIVYVSCNPATLARDAGLFVHRAGYRCTAAGAVNMFPHTAHVEGIAVFDLEKENGAQRAPSDGGESS